MIISHDVETYAEIDIKIGVAPYAEHPATHLVVWCYAIDDGPVQTWWPGDPLPWFVHEGAFLTYHETLQEPIYHSAWNAPFERNLFRCEVADPGAISHWIDPSAQAAAASLPAGLGACAEALQLPEHHQKDSLGKLLIQRLSKPYREHGKLLDKPRDYEVTLNRERVTVDYLVRMFGAYCAQDVETERAVRKKLEPLNLLAPGSVERQVWELDQIINERGIPLDTFAIEEAVALCDEIHTSTDRRMAEATGGRVLSVSALPQLKKWLLDEHGLSFKSLDKAASERLLASRKLPESARRALAVRVEAGKSSTAKYTALRRFGERARGAMRYYGAHTGRWSGRVIQPHNFPRGAGEQYQRRAIGLFPQGAEALEQAMGEPAMEVMSKCLRGMICAPVGHELVVSDFSAIEGRVAAWLAREELALQIYATDGRAYEAAAADIYSVPVAEITKDDPRRQVGKVAELALGFGGGAGAFAQMAAAYGVDLEQMADGSPFTDDIQRILDAVAADKYPIKTIETPGQAFAEVIKLQWRDSRPETVATWAKLEEAFVRAVDRPKKVVVVNDLLKFLCVGNVLFVQLPSGRRLHYHRPKIVQLDGWPHRELRFTGPSSTRGGVWAEEDTYGGKLFENVVQSVARDLLAEALLRVEASGWPVVMHVHDEIVSEVPVGTVSCDEFTEVMELRPDWAVDVPIKANTFITERYRK